MQILCALLTFLFFCSCFGGKICRPVLVIDGFLTPQHGLQICYALKAYDPTCTCLTFQPLSIASHPLPMEDQIKLYQQQLIPVFQKYPNGVNAFGCSLGSALWDGIIKETVSHTVKTFVSVSGPLMGLYGIPGGSQVLQDEGLSGLNNLTVQLATSLSYTPNNATLISDLWHDINETRFLEQQPYLPRHLNLVQHPDFIAYKTNFERVEKLAMFVGSNEETIIPSISSFYGFYNKDMVQTPMEEQEIYINNTFGLQSLNNAGNLTRITIPNVDHNTIVLPQTITQYIAPAMDC